MTSVGRVLFARYIVLLYIIGSNSKAKQIKEACKSLLLKGRMNENKDSTEKKGIVDTKKDDFVC